MLEELRNARSVELDAKEYIDDFWPRYQRITTVFWKFEVYQHFREPEEPSWQAYARGEWDKSLSLMAKIQEAAREEMKDGRFKRRRIRVVDLPLTPYLQWELNYLPLRAQAGEDIRVVMPEHASRFGSLSELPELVVLGNEALYEVKYDEACTLSGAKRIDNSAAVGRCHEVFDEIFAHGENVQAFYDREVKLLPPPSLEKIREDITCHSGI